MPPPESILHFGLDLAWDTFLCLGTFLFGLAMLRRPGFGPVLGGVGRAPRAGARG
jgi:hypothetical protein